jgi:hypothetical protein
MDSNTTSQNSATENNQVNKFVLQINPKDTYTLTISKRKQGFTIKV